MYSEVTVERLESSKLSGIFLAIHGFIVRRGES
jgi:hypothetical protein